MLVRGHDLGTSLLFFGLFVVLLYVATERVSWVIVGVLLFAGGAYVAYQLFGTVQTRVERLAAPVLAARTTPTGYQLRQSLFGLGTGGIFGTGLGSGHPELVPLPATDFIISSFGEETRPVRPRRRCSCSTRCFVARGFAAGLAVRDSFGKLLASGLAFLFGAAAVRRRRRRHPAAARDRPDHAVPVLRRLVAARQLGPPRAAAADLRRRPPPGRPPRRPRPADPTPEAVAA